MDSLSVLKQVQSGAMSVEEAEKYFSAKAFEEMGYASWTPHVKDAAVFLKSFIAAINRTRTCNRFI